MADDLLLLSNSTLHGHEFLEHALDPIGEFLADLDRILFAPFALDDHDGYTRVVQDALDPIGVEVVGLHTVDALEAVRSESAIFVGGGNTFRLLRALQRLGLVEPVHKRVRDGTLRYLGSSAGTTIWAVMMASTPASMAAWKGGNSVCSSSEAGLSITGRRM